MSFTHITNQDMKKKEKELQAKEAELRKREQVGCYSTLSFVSSTIENTIFRQSSFTILLLVNYESRVRLSTTR